MIKRPLLRAAIALCACASQGAVAAWCLPSTTAPACLRIGPNSSPSQRQLLISEREEHFERERSHDHDNEQRHEHEEVRQERHDDGRGAEEQHHLAEERARADAERRLREEQDRRYLLERMLQ